MARPGKAREQHWVQVDLDEGRGGEDPAAGKGGDPVVEDLYRDVCEHRPPCPVPPGLFGSLKT